MVKDAWWLAKKELKFNKIPLTFSVLVTIFFGGMASLDFTQTVQNVVNPESAKDRFLFIDILFVMVTPALAAIFMASPYLSYRAIKEDPFSKRMAFYRSLPIPVEALALSRMMVMIVTLLMLSFVFYGTIILATYDQLFELVTIKEFAIFITIWLGYALALGGMNPYIEYGTNGKVLHLFPYIFFTTVGVAALLIYFILGIGIVETTLTLSINIGWSISLFFLIIGLLGFSFWNTLLTKRLSTKDYV